MREGERERDNSERKQREDGSGRVRVKREGARGTMMDVTRRRHERAHKKNNIKSMSGRRGAVERLLRAAETKRILTSND